MRRGVAIGLWLVVFGFLTASAAAGQNPPAQAPGKAPAPPTPASMAGRYEGTAVTPNGTEALVAELKVDKDIITGLITTSTAVVSVTGGTLTGDKLSLTIDMGGEPGTIAGIVKIDTVEGQWVLGDNSGPFTMKKAVAAGTQPAPQASGAAAAKPAADAAPSPAAGDPLTGDWDAVIDAGGNQMPFLLSIKLDGQKVTGQLASDMGTMPFEGTWANGALNFSFAGPNGMAITMSAAIVEGKLAGTFTMADGQFTGGWAAARRK